MSDKPGDAQCLDAPNGYKISGEGAGASFAKGSATVKALERDGGTLLSYNRRSAHRRQVGGTRSASDQRNHQEAH